MMICGMTETEEIIVHPDNAPHESHRIHITKDKDRPVFYVTSCCDVGWSWDFWYSKTNYDIVKHLIVDCVFESKTIAGLLKNLDETFTEFCTEFVFYDEEDEIDDCDGDCENCEL